MGDDYRPSEIWLTLSGKAPACDGAKDHLRRSLAASQEDFEECSSMKGLRGSDLSTYSPVVTISGRRAPLVDGQMWKLLASPAMTAVYSPENPIEQVLETKQIQLQQ